MSTSYSTMPEVIAAMDYRACPVCGADEMQELPSRAVRQWYCPSCKNRNFATVPSAAQQEIAKAVLTPWSNPCADDDE